jgi:hypothetical protein
VVIAGAADTEIETVAWAVRPSASPTWTVKGNEPGVLGVPVNAPVVGWS